MHDEIGKVAGEIWNTLSSRGELSLAQLKKDVKQKAPLFDWAVGWLAREGKIVIARHKSSFRIQLTDTERRATSA